VGAWFKFENITPRSGKTYRAACRSAPARPVAALEAGQGHQSLLGAAARPVAGMDAGKGMSGQGLQRRTLKRVPTSSPVARDRRLLVASPGKVEQEARRGQGGGPESGSWAAGSGQSDGEASGGSGQSDGEASGGSGQSDGETAAAPSRMKKRLAANASRRGGAGMSVHTSDSDSDAGSPSNA
jgi:hypothetical protein